MITIMQYLKRFIASIYFLLFLTNLCLFFLAEFENSCSNISLVIGKYVTSVSLVSLISCGK